MKKVAITGGISCGKSLVVHFLETFGAYVINADKIVHNHLKAETEIGQKVIKLLGNRILVDGEIDRKRIAKLVFLNPILLRKLEELLHPIVYNEIEKTYQKLLKEETPPPLLVAEIPLLFETGGEKHFDFTVTVTSDSSQCWERYRNNTGYEREDFNQRSARQLSQSEKANQADYIITNNGTTDELRTQAKKIFDKLQESDKKHQ